MLNKRITIVVDDDLEQRIETRRRATSARRVPPMASFVRELVERALAADPASSPSPFAASKVTA